jgi:hypothetical protein
VPTGKVLIDRLARDSRKFNVRALFASQLAGDLLRVSGFASLVNAVFVGRTDDDEAQTEALRLLRVPTGVGYEQMLGTLSPRPRHDDRPDDTPRQFVFADGHGGVEKVRIDLEAPHLEHVREALDTNPDANRVAVRGVPASASAVRAPDEPAALAARPGPVPPGGIDLDDDESGLDLSAPDIRSGRATRVGPGGDDELVGGRYGGRAGSVQIVPSEAQLLDDEDVDLFDDLDDPWADDADDEIVDGNGPEGDPGQNGTGAHGSERAADDGHAIEHDPGAHVGAAGEAGRR